MATWTKHRGARRITQEDDVEEIWTPPIMQLPDERKRDGGSVFDDEMQTKEQVAKDYANQVKQLLEHLNQRPDHVVYVGSVEDRANMRQVFNWWVQKGALMRHPNIRIDYGVADGAIRVGD